MPVALVALHTEEFALPHLSAEQLKTQTQKLRISGSLPAYVTSNNRHGSLHDSVRC